MIEANNPEKKSFVNIPENHNFPIQNLPFGVFKTSNTNKRAGVALGNFVIDLVVLHNTGFFDELNLPDGIFENEYLNEFIALGKPVTRSVRNRLSQLFDEQNNELQSKPLILDSVLIPHEKVTLCMPIKVGDYTDFYSSREHATNVGTMFRDPNNALLPNWLHIPVGYHGRASSIILSGQNIHRPKGQTKPADADKPIFGPSKLLDFELEMAFVTHQGKPLGETISANEAEDYIFGMVILNDWSARDIQTWEYVPLGPFLAKNFASSISPWIVTLDALQPYKTKNPEQNPEPLDYLKTNGNKSYDINLEVYITPQNGQQNLVCASNFKYMYWTMAQQLAHHTINGCNINAADLCGSGTISGPTPNSYGSMLELAWKGTKPIKLNDGTERKFINDFDTVTMRAFCSNGNTKIGFGEVTTMVLPAK